MARKAIDLGDFSRRTMANTLEDLTLKILEHNWDGARNENLTLPQELNKMMARDDKEVILYHEMDQKILGDDYADKCIDSQAFSSLLRVCGRQECEDDKHASKFIWASPRDTLVELFNDQKTCEQEASVVGPEGGKNECGKEDDAKGDIDLCADNENMDMDDLLHLNDGIPMSKEGAIISEFDEGLDAARELLGLGTTERDGDGDIGDGAAVAEGENAGGGKPEASKAGVAQEESSNVIMAEVGESSTRVTWEP